MRQRHDSIVNINPLNDFPINVGFTEQVLQYLFTKNQNNSCSSRRHYSFSDVNSIIFNEVSCNTNKDIVMLCNLKQKVMIVRTKLPRGIFYIQFKYCETKFTPNFQKVWHYFV